MVAKFDYIHSILLLLWGPNLFPPTLRWRVLVCFLKQGFCTFKVDSMISRQKHFRHKAQSAVKLSNVIICSKWDTSSSLQLSSPRGLILKTMENVQFHRILQMRFCVHAFLYLVKFELSVFLRYASVKWLFFLVLHLLLISFPSLYPLANVWWDTIKNWIQNWNSPYLVMVIGSVCMLIPLSEYIGPPKCVDYRV